MNHLIKYELFESKKFSKDASELMQTLKDIGIELEDDEYRVSIKQSGNDEIDVIIDRSKLYDLVDISDVLRRMVNFMKSEGFRHWIHPIPGLSKSVYVKIDDLPESRIWRNSRSKRKLDIVKNNHYIILRFRK